MNHRITTASIHEIFSGIQGEGLLVGLRQIFVRLHGCCLDCAYCDTPASHGAPPAVCAVERAAGSRQIEQWHNPLRVEDVLAAIRQLAAGYPHHSVSLTGGEPLLHGAFLDALLPRMHEDGVRSFLETNGVLPDELAALETLPQHIAMDIKLPTIAGVAPQWERHAAFLDVVMRRLANPLADMHLQVKLVFSAESLEDITRAAELIAACNSGIPCILQPVTPRPHGPATPDAATVLEAQRLATRQLREVRVIPQTHVLLGQW